MIESIIRKENKQRQQTASCIFVSATISKIYIIQSMSHYHVVNPSLTLTSIQSTLSAHSFSPCVCTPFIALLKYLPLLLVVTPVVTTALHPTLVLENQHQRILSPLLWYPFTFKDFVKQSGIYIRNIRSLKRVTIIDGKLRVYFSRFDLARISLCKLAGQKLKTSVRDDGRDIGGYELSLLTQDLCMLI